MECINCGSEVNGEFCHNCGQPVKSTRLTFRSLISDVQNRFFGIDNKFIRTVKDMTFRPEVVVETAIKGNKVRYISSINYYFILLTIVVLLMTFLDIDMMEYIGLAETPFSPSNIPKEQAARQMAVTNWIFENFKLTSFIVIPFCALATSILFFKSQYNFVERAVMIIYWQAHPMILTILSMLLYVLTGFSLAWFDTLFTFLFCSYVCARFFDHNSKWFAALKGILVFPIGYILVFILMIIGMIVVAIVSPETLEAFKPKT